MPGPLWTLLHLATLFALFGGLTPVRASGDPAGSQARHTAPGHAPREVLVEFYPGVGSGARAALLHRFNHRRLPHPAGQRWTRVKIRAGQSMEAALQAYRGHFEVDSAQPNYRYQASAQPDDPRFDRQWALHNPTGRDLALAPAWDHVTDCSGVVVAVVDTGINYTHQDLAGNLWDGTPWGLPHHGKDFIDSDNDPMDLNGHGTHVAGTIGAVGNNARGVAGVCWQAELMAVRALGQDGIGTTADVLQGIEFAVAHGAEVVNLSFGGPHTDPLLAEAIRRARAQGVIVVTAAGNGGEDGVGDNNDAPGNVQNPCNLPPDNLLCVAALDRSYRLAPFSNFGPVSVDLGAPGTRIWSGETGRVVRDDFTQGWRFSETGRGWRPRECRLSGETLELLVNPPDWCAFGTYANRSDDRAYKRFDLSGALAARLGYRAIGDLEAGADTFRAHYKAAGGDPFRGGTRLHERTGSSGGRSNHLRGQLTGCLTATCTIGFQLASDRSGTGLGVGIWDLTIRTAERRSNRYTSKSGTSMAAPHVAGLAALVWAFNPRYTYRDVIRALRRGGKPVAALAGRTTTGKAADAVGALRYIHPPTGLTVTVVD